MQTPAFSFSFSGVQEKNKTCFTANLFVKSAVVLLFNKFKECACFYICFNDLHKI